MLVRSASGASSSTASGVLCTGTDSPVSAASLTRNCSVLSKRMSAGTRFFRANDDDITGKQIFRINLLLFSVTPDSRPMLSQLAQRLHRTDRLPFAEETDQRIDQRHGQQSDAFRPARRGKCGDGRCGQNDDDDALELIGKD